MTVAPENCIQNLTILNNNVKLSKFMIYYFKTYEIIFGVDLGFQKKSFKSKIFFRVFDILKATCLCALYAYIFKHFSNYMVIYWYFSDLVQYFISVCILNFSVNSISVFQFFNALLNVDLELMSQHFDYKGIILLLIMCFSIFIRTLATYVCCLYFQENCLHFLIKFFSLIPAFFSDTFLVIYMFMFYYVYRRLSLLTTILNNNSTDIVSSLKLYMFIIDITEQFNSTFGKVFVIKVLCFIPQTMSAIYESLVIFKEYAMVIIYALFFRYLWLLLSISLLFAAPLRANMLTNQANKMKILLDNLLLEEKNEQRYRDIERLIRYIESRPFKLYACRIVPLDGTLPIIVLNICVTYLIVIIQFTHIY